MPTRPILVLNSGSSSLKFSMWEASTVQRQKLLEGEIEGIGVGQPSNARFWIKSWMDGAEGTKLVDESPRLTGLGAAFELISKELSRPPFPPPQAIGHRMVCGGPTVVDNQFLTPALIDEMEHYIAFAPLHAPSEIFLMRQAMKLYPNVPNFVCLDSWFHRDLPQVTRHLPIPGEYTAMGLRRFGAHGLSYESIVAQLEPHVPPRLIVAHLGNGASVCAIRDGKSVDTSMGLTPTGGIISGSRTGDLDPGVLLLLLRKLAEREESSAKAADELETIVNRKSGLAGISGLSSDMRKLREAISSGDAAARLAVDEFVYVLRKYIGAYIAVLGGLDMLVFTGGIGENDSATRAEVCNGLECFGIALDHERNQAGGPLVSADKSVVTVRVTPPVEDRMIVNHVCRLMDKTF